MNIKLKDENIVHFLKFDGYTGCGANTNDNRNDWERTTKPVNCKKNGCGN